MKSRFYMWWLCVFLVGGVFYLMVSVGLGRTKYSSSQTDEDITITVSDVEVAKVSPQRELLMFRICVDAPRNREGIYIEGNYVAAGLEREFSSNFSSAIASICNDISLYIFPEESRPIELHIFSVVLLNDKEISGAWDFSVSQDKIQKHKVLTLLDLDAQPVSQYDIELTASDLRRVEVPEKWNSEISALRANLCLVSPLDVEWKIWDATLDVGEGEKIRPFFYLDPLSLGESIPRNCSLVGFEVPENRSYHQVRLTIFGLFFPPDLDTEENCKEYLRQLQKAIDDRDFGVSLECVYFPAWSESAHWGINYDFKPPWISDLDARLLIGSQELYTVKGKWEFELKINP